MELSKVLAGVKTLQKSRSGSLEISGIAYDSRQVKQGWLFAAIKGEKLDGNQFVSQAVERGASAVLSEQPPRRGSRFLPSGRPLRRPPPTSMATPPASSS